ncbi:MAG: 2-phospho-L-lactate transferase [Mycobacteriaceae bacterium]
MKITVLVGGVGGARFLQGVQKLLNITAGKPQPSSNTPDSAITAIVNVGDDAWLHGLRICPDLDTCMYTLGGGIDRARGWGHANETWNAKEELAKYGATPDWFGLGDRDLATHLIRSQMLRAGYPLSAVTEALCDRWQPGIALLPATDDRCETHVVITDPADNEQRAIHFQEWWVRHRAQVPTHGFAQVGAEQATPGPGVLEAIHSADVILIAPSNPVVSIGAILSIPGLRGALRTTPAQVIGISPVIAGKHLRGMADECLQAIGVETSAEAIAQHYGSRQETGILDGWLISPGDHAQVSGLATKAVPLLMTTPEATAEMVRSALELAGITRL